MRVTDVTESALLRRINRKLATSNQAVRKWRTAGSQNGESWDRGDYYRIDYQRNAMLALNVNLEQLARSIGVLESYEEVAA